MGKILMQIVHTVFVLPHSTVLLQVFIAKGALSRNHFYGLYVDCLLRANKVATTKIMKVANVLAPCNFNANEISGRVESSLIA